MLTMPVTLTRWIVRFAALIVQAGVGTRPGPDSRSAAGAGQTDCDGSVASAGVRAGAALSEVSPGAESGAVVECRRGPRVIELSGGDVRRNGASRDWDRRYLGTATRCEDQSQRDLSGSGALVTLAYGESQWAALACAMVLAEIPWAGRVWALPFLTALCPSERYHRQRGQHHKTLPEWAGQLLGLIQRWLPGREVDCGRR